MTGYICQLNGPAVFLQIAQPAERALRLSDVDSRDGAVFLVAVPADLQLDEHPRRRVVRTQLEDPHRSDTRSAHQV
jgi:hypothetical protein